jgi:hypothetical protein
MVEQVEDIRYETKSPFLVTGFFTPDYFPLAAAFSANLIEHDIAHHLYARPKSAGQWGHQTLQKPSVLQAARRDHPDRMIILMDVDCRVRGDISPILDTVGDISVPMGRKPMKNGTALKPGTRVLLVRPTSQTDTFLKLWDDMCRLNVQPVGNDEIRLQMAIEDSAGRFAITTLPQHFTGKEIRKAGPADMIVHDSARDEARLFGSVRKDVKHGFRRLRNAIHHAVTGRDYKSAKHR